MFAIVQAAGWPIWFLLFASVIAVALIIERSISLRASRIIPPTLLDQVIAVPAMIFYRYFRAKVDVMLVDMEMRALKLVEVIHGERQ